MKSLPLVPLLVARLSAQVAFAGRAMQETRTSSRRINVAVERAGAAPVDQLTPSRRAYVGATPDRYVTGREYGVDLEGLQVACRFRGSARPALPRAWPGSRASTRWSIARRHAQP
jgi:hypothetical protein